MENRQNRAYLLDKKQILPASQTVNTAWIAPKICQGQPPTMYSECSRFHPNRFNFSGVIVKRMNTAKLPHKINQISAFEANKYQRNHWHNWVAT